ncbi:hypothetical protein D3C87_1590570 [compost metagenome]
MMRTSTFLTVLEPRGSNSPSCRARSSLACRDAGMSPISSRNSVPPWASSNLPFRGFRSAPVNAPGATPKNSASSSASGMAATLTATKGPSARSDCW